jgi:hypothetical protein
MNTIIKTYMFQKLDYCNLMKIAGIGHKTANFLSIINVLNNIGDINNVSSSKDIKTLIKQYNKYDNNKIRYNFINNDIIKMKNGSIYKIEFLK